MSNDRWKIGVTNFRWDLYRVSQSRRSCSFGSLDWNPHLRCFRMYDFPCASTEAPIGTIGYLRFEIAYGLWLSWNSAIMSARSLPINVLGVHKVTVSEVFFPSIIGNQRLSSNVQPTGLCPVMHIRKSFAVARNLEVFFRGCRCKAKWSDNGFVWRWGTSKSVG